MVVHYQLLKPHRKKTASERERKSNGIHTRQRLFHSLILSRNSPLYFTDFLPNVTMAIKNTLWFVFQLWNLFRNKLVILMRTQKHTTWRWHCHSRRRRESNEITITRKNCEIVNLLLIPNTKKVTRQMQNTNRLVNASIFNWDLWFWNEDECASFSYAARAFEYNMEFACVLTGANATTTKPCWINAN